jgi:hypothetical protein
MRHFFVFAVLLILLLQCPIRAHAASSNGRNIYFETSIFPEYVNRNDTGSITTSPGVATETGLGYDTRTSLGFVFANSLVVGATYNLYHLQTKRDAVSGGEDGLDETTHTEQWGPMIGWLGANWRFLATYFMSGKNAVETRNFDTSETTGDVTITKTKISGYQLAAGYSFYLTPSFALGPTVIYRNITYANQSKTNRLNSNEDYSDVSLYSNSTEATFKLMLTLAFQF